MMRALLSHDYADAKQRRCSGRPKTAAAERPDKRLSGGAERRPLQPRDSRPEATGFRAAIAPRALHWHRDEHPRVH